MTCGASFSVLPWARVASFWLALSFGLVQVPVNAQSTDSGPRPSESRPNAQWSLSEASAELLSTLRDLKDRYPKVLEESESLRNEVRRLSDELVALSSQSATWEAESKRLSDSVKSLTQRFEDYRKASEDRAKADQKAIDQARGQLWLWGGGGFLAGLLTGIVIAIML